MGPGRTSGDGLAASVRGFGGAALAGCVQSTGVTKGTSSTSSTSTILAWIIRDSTSSGTVVRLLSALALSSPGRQPFGAPKVLTLLVCLRRSTLVAVRPTSSRTLFAFYLVYNLPSNSLDLDYIQTITCMRDQLLVGLLDRWFFCNAAHALLCLDRGSSMQLGHAQDPSRDSACKIGMVSKLISMSSTRIASIFSPPLSSLLSCSSISYCFSSYLHPLNPSTCLKK